MKNQLIPIEPSNDGETWQPSLVEMGYQHQQLVEAPEGGLHTKTDHQGFSFRRDLKGLVRECGGMPIIETDEGEIYAVKNAADILQPMDGFKW